MTRILGGHGKGRRLRTPRGETTRPTGARVRQTLFDVLAPRLPGCRFLDAFAGSGAVGLEALSRGAARVTLVDSDAAAVAALRENARALARAGGEVEVYRQDARVALSGLARAGTRYDVVFLDPPYAGSDYVALVGAVADAGLLAPDALVVVEHFHKRALPETIGALVRSRELRVGDHRLSFYRQGEGLA